MIIEAEKKHPKTNPILASVSSSISDLKKNPAAIIRHAGGNPVAILSHNKPVFYAIPPDVYENLLDKIDDFELADIARSRLDDDVIMVSIDDL